MANNTSDKDFRELFANVVSLPTAPLCEGYVQRFVMRWCAAQGVHCTFDAFGNMMLSNHARGAVRMIVMAHMDHPALVMSNISPRGKISAELRGGLNKKQVAKTEWRMFASPPILTARSSANALKSAISEVVTNCDHLAPRSTACFSDGVLLQSTACDDAGHVTLRLRDDAKKIASLQQSGAKKYFAMLDLPRVQWRGNRVYTRVIDNLANCAVILDWLRAAKNRTERVMGILTRGEEIGFVGAAHLLRTNGLPKDIPTVVLEASNAKVARVKIGGGPVLRVGDRLLSFDPRIDLWQRAAADALVQRDAERPPSPRKRAAMLARTSAALAHHSPNVAPFTYQRALMTGGRMEASLYILAGAFVGSLILPLGNYHNNGPRGPAPEFVAWSDVVKLRAWLDALITTPSPQKIATARYREFVAHALKQR